MKKIKLRNSNKYAIVDDEDYEYLSQFKWLEKVSYSKYGSTTYAIRPNYIPVSKDFPKGKRGGSLSMHTVILNTPKGKCVDHINGNGLDNRRKNIRVVTQKENQLNRHVINRNNSSGIPGVHFCKIRGKWVAQATRNYRNFNLGRYNTKKEAKVAREKFTLGESL